MSVSHWCFDQPARHLFEMTSDHFFATQDLPRLFPKGIDLSFLDGMHLFEFRLRDFLNTEQLARRYLVIVLHDCCPVSTETTDATLATAGDYRKAIGLALSVAVSSNPGYRLPIVLACAPTGLCSLLDHLIDKDPSCIIEISLSNS